MKFLLMMKLLFYILIQFLDIWMFYFGHLYSVWVKSAFDHSVFYTFNLLAKDLFNFNLIFILLLMQPGQLCPEDRPRCLTSPDVPPTGTFLHGSASWARGIFSSSSSPPPLLLLLLLFLPSSSSSPLLLFGSALILPPSTPWLLPPPLRKCFPFLFAVGRTEPSGLAPIPVLVQRPPLHPPTPTPDPVRPFLGNWPTSLISFSLPSSSCVLFPVFPNMAAGVALPVRQSNCVTTASRKKAGLNRDL